jgi:GGDEF domain-containing protein
VLIPAVGFALAERQVDKLARPEYLLFAAWMGGEITIATAVGLSGGPKSPGITWLAIPVVVLSSRFSIRGVLAGVGLVLALLVTVSFAADAHAVLHDPPLLVAPAALIVAVAMLSSAIRQADLEHRRNALIDPLTGLLNRKALVSRVEELAQLSGLTREPVGLIVADLDRFKRVNDTLGAFDLAYRVGGEEFLVLLPGADAAQTRQVAEELRVAVEAEPVGDGVAVTISLGVGASERGAAFEYDAVFAAADLALYEAKHGGRNQVRGGDLSELVVA